MKHKALVWAAEQKVPNTNCYVVLIALASRVDDFGYAKAKQNEIALQVKLARETVSRTIKKLEELGYLSKTKCGYLLNFNDINHGGSHGT